MARATGLSTVEMLVSGLDHPEGVTIDTNGVVYAGGEAGQVYRVTPTGQLEEIANTGGFNLGLCVAPSGAVLIADTTNRTIWSWTEATGLSVLLASSDEASFVHPNAIAAASHGIYFSDSGNWLQADGTIWLIAEDGSARTVTDEANRYTNGLAVSPDGQWLYAVESNFGVVRLRIADDGSLGAAETVLELADDVPDGVAFAPSGDLYVSFYQPNSVGRLTVDGEWSIVLNDPQAQLLSMPTNVAFLPDGRMVIANLGGWHLAVSTIAAR
ncbi:hypothetical protein BH10ACT7_BH10ACT7_00950 [soil metagenome]